MCLGDFRIPDGGQAPCVQQEQSDYDDHMFFWATPALTAAERVLLDEARFSPWRRSQRRTLTERELRAEPAMMILTPRNVLRAAAGPMSVSGMI